MNKSTLVDAISRDAGLGSAAAEAALSALVGAITRALAEGDKVTIPGFGTFEVRERAARSGRNPRTGEPMEIAASKAPAFKPATALKDAVST
ncbi:HU family DNA-binding protein [Motilibacter aurantiacus]|uniref:HU family DNA-binding protein n=1 Tax=Motilibacter aurantiacus TaxID=2714955 RepID=UPI00140D5F8B|nr:HU family DNA-binding protein [Motilibacter aurantiacus]NHC47513.1 HU family DNA-binding protein [Motilibacter aurantiacus]